ncbi:hypothetical protein JXQ31_18355 [candidate division KSB1 bacterium]|nr:hypothetical protein [candidate division KSB1 bacterium]
MKKSLKIFIILALSFSMVYAQKKAVAPPTPIPLPSDSVQAGRGQSQKVDIKDSQLDLPDVLILGQDKSKRTITDKQDATQAPPSLLKVEKTYEPVSIWFTREAVKPEIEKKSQINNRLSWGQLSGGGYTTLSANAGHWQKYSGGDWGLHGWINRSSGQYENSRYLIGAIAGETSIAPAPHITASLKAEYNLNQKGLFNALNSNNFERKINTICFGSELIYDLPGSSNALLGFDVNKTGLKSDTTSQFEKRDNFWYNLYFNYSKTFPVVKVTASGRYIRETSSFGADSADIKDSFGEAGLEIQSQIYSKMIVAAGAGYQVNTTGSVTNESLLSPYMKLNFMPDRRLGLSLRYQSGLTYKTFSERLVENPFLFYSVPLTVEKEKHAVLFNIDFEPVSKLKINAGIKHRIMDNLTFWESDSTTQLVRLNFMQNPELTDISFGIHLRVSEQTQVQVNYIHLIDKIDKNKTLTNYDKIPYRPEYRIPVNATIELLKGTFLLIDADFYGPRMSRLDSGEDLPAFTLVNAGLKQNFGKINALVSVRNIFDSEYTLWKYFPGMGIHIIVGISAKF